MSSRRSRKLRAALLLTTCLCACGDTSTSDAAPPAAAPPAASPRNLIFIVVDTLRADHLGSYGGPVATPFLDSLAARGVRFARSYSHIPLTGPSHASFFTSGLPSDHGCTVNSQALDPANVTLAEILATSGFSTAAFVSLGVLSEQFGFAQGFDSYFDYFPGRWWKSGDEINEELIGWLSESPPDEPAFLLLHYSDPHTPYAPPDEVYTEVRLSLDDQAFASLPTDSRLRSVPITLAPGKNTITFELPPGLDHADFGCGRVHLSDKRLQFWFSTGDTFLASQDGAPPFPELPTAMGIVNPTQEALDTKLTLTLRMNLGVERWAEWYAKEVAYVDARIAEAVDALKAAGLWDDAIVVFTSDHGEGLGQHGHMQHVEQLYDSLLHIPLILVAPGLLPEGEVVETPVRHVDILPTLLELLGLLQLNDDSASPFRGTSLLPLIQNGTDGTAPHLPVISETHTPEATTDQRSIVFQGYKYIVNSTTGEEELYALHDDPGELTNLNDSRPDMVARLRRLMDDEYALQYGPGEVGSGEVELSAEDRAQLEALGYLR